MNDDICKAKIEITKGRVLAIIWYVIGAVAFYISTFVASRNSTFIGSRHAYISKYLFGFRFYRDDGTYSVEFSIVALLLGIIVTLAVIALPFIVRAIMRSIASKCELTLKEQIIQGQRKTLFSMKMLSLPLEKVDNVMILGGIGNKPFGGKTVGVHSASGVIKFPWVQNAEEFVNVTLAKIEERKNSIQSNGATGNAGGSDVSEQIVKLKSLLDAGAITQEEYDEKRKELLARI